MPLGLPFSHVSTTPSRDRGPAAEERPLLGVIGGEGLPAGGSGEGQDGPQPGSAEWLRRAETLIASLTEVVSVRVVVGPGGEVDEIHVLTTDAVGPKQTVRNVESALYAQLGTPVDHKKISVAQVTTGGTPEPTEAGPRSERRVRRMGATAPAEARPRLEPVREPSAGAAARPAADDRILFVGHAVDSIRSRKLRLRVAIDWQGRRFVGEASSAELVRPRLEGFAAATLRALERALDPEGAGAAAEGALSLDGVQVIKAFDRQFVVVAVSAYLGNRLTSLTGAATVSNSLDRAAILATLQATDRRVRAFLNGRDLALGGPSGELDDPFEVWE